MDNCIRIERIPYEEPYHIELYWEVSNGSISANFMYYDNADSLEKMAEALEVFPRHTKDIFLYEIGSEKPEDNFAYYFRFRVFTTNNIGGSAIQIRFCNNAELPNKEVVEFCIKAEPADINRLGKQFRQFSKLKETYLAWSEKESFVGEKYEHA